MRSERLPSPAGDIAALSAWAVVFTAVDSTHESRWCRRNPGTGYEVLFKETSG
jgi:hypothetical protein